MRAMYSSFRSATHHIFFPPRLQVGALEQDADALPPHLWHQLPPHRFLGNEPNAPACMPQGWLATDHSDNPLARARLQQSLLARTRLLIKRQTQPLLLAPRGNPPQGLRAPPTFPATCAAVC